MTNTIKTILLFTLFAASFGTQAHGTVINCAERIMAYKATIPESYEMVWVKGDISEVRSTYSKTTLETKIKYCKGRTELSPSRKMCVSGLMMMEEYPSIEVNQESFDTENLVEAIVALDRCKLILGRVKK
ncbi:hypothetical protein [Vibrio owensii]|uniref:Uncharacterized protein n=1 Tax=Vibrio owensii CAIM 1854 = LMG 25443 TaxID=1229493 RepID=A0A0C1ZB50_9VIBR|nr:hypothetical protein [Vibrio owensii]KIF53359.1 hypothetical protein H735_10585 [Vibrio owensii CAIM 1854 = LMG 25443]